MTLVTLLTMASSLRLPHVLCWSPSTPCWGCLCMLSSLRSFSLSEKGASQPSTGFSRVRGLCHHRPQFLSTCLVLILSRKRGLCCTGKWQREPILRKQFAAGLGRSAGRFCERFSHLCYGVRRSTVVQVAGDDAVTVSVEKRRCGLEAQRCSAWAAVGKLAPSAPSGLKARSAYGQSQ